MAKKYFLIQLFPDSPTVGDYFSRINILIKLFTIFVARKRGSFEDDDDEDDILKELGVSPINYNKSRAENNKAKPKCGF